MTATVHIKTDFLQMCTVFVKNKMFGWDVDVMEGRFCRKKKCKFVLVIVTVRLYVVEKNLIL